MADLLIDGMCYRGVQSRLGPACSEGGKCEDDVGLVEVVGIPECLCVCCVREVGRGGGRGEVKHKPIIRNLNVKAPPTVT